MSCLGGGSGKGGSASLTDRGKELVRRYNMVVEESAILLYEKHFAGFF